MKAVASKARGCAYCAHAPVHHWVQCTIATGDVVFASCIPSSATSRIVRAKAWFERRVDPLASWLERSIGSLLLLLRVLKAQTALSGNHSERTRVIWDEARTRDYAIEQIALFNSAEETCRVQFAKKPWQYFSSIPIPPQKRVFDAGWVDDKALFKKRFALHTLPVAQGTWFVREDAAVAYAVALRKPVIVKPRDGSRARHTSVNLHTPEDIRAAFRRAQQLCLFVMVEAYIPGDTYRATCVDGTFVAAMHFHKPSMVADGIATVAQLCERYNAALPYPDVQPVHDDTWFTDALARQGVTRDSIPPQGTTVTFAEHSERTNGGYNEDVTARIPIERVQCIEKAAQVAKVPVIGFDIISEDITDLQTPMTFIEGNTLPFIDIHHTPTIGEPQNVAAAVWDMWLPYSANRNT